MARYIPKQGDFVIVSFDPQAGHEQKCRRPALVVSSSLFNRHTRLAMLCPITSTFRNFPFHVEIPRLSSVNGYVMVEQIKSVDFASRKAKFAEKAPQSVIDEVLSILDACIFEAK